MNKKICDICGQEISFLSLFGVDSIKIIETKFLVFKQTSDLCDDCSKRLRELMRTEKKQLKTA